MADNDLAVGRAIEAISHSPYWDDTAFFILEDDAQAGGDHVDAHRSIALVVSKYSPHAADGAPSSTAASTPPSAWSAPWSCPRPAANEQRRRVLLGHLQPVHRPRRSAPYTADYSNRDNGLIYTANTKNAVGARESSKMDFTHDDSQPTEKLNVILWKDAMGKKPVPAMLTTRPKKTAKDDD